MKIFLGILFLLGAAACGFFAFLEAGGSHGVSSFTRGFPENLARNSAPVALGGMAACLLISVVSFARRR